MLSTFDLSLMTNMVYRSVLCLLLMIQVKHGRWFLILDSPTCIYYKMDASGLIEQLRAISLQMARFLAWKYFTTGFFTTKFRLSMEEDLYVHFLLIPSLLTVSFLLPPPFISCVPTQGEYTKEIQMMTSSQVKLIISLEG